MTSPVFALSDKYIEQSAALDPGTATYLGIPGYDHLMTDFSPAGHAAREALSRSTLAQLDSLATDSGDDRLAAGVLREGLQADIMAFDAGDHLSSIRIIAGDVDAARSIFDLMPTDASADWEVIAKRMANVPGAFAGMRESWSLGMERGITASLRQVKGQAEQLSAWAGTPSEPGFFTTFAESASSVPGAPMDALRAAAADASRAMAETADFLMKHYASRARAEDGCGRDAHEVARRRFLGMQISAEDAYEWGWEETMRLDAEIKKVAQQIVAGASVNEVRHLLDTDPNRAVHGEENLRAWLQELMDEAMDFLLSNGHFDIDPRVRTVEAMISPPGGAAAMYYTGPSEDLSRPGRTWYPANGRSVFPRWGEPTTAYHEGVPGHHLQIAVATVNRDRLSRYQRNTFVSGHGEGWALYAERLMDEFGFLDNPEYRLGYLYAQVFRAARVVVDCGVHCGLPIPKHSSWHAGEAWTPDLMFEFMNARSSSDEEFNWSEVNRYLGWPAQAISYKLGEREWLALRDEARAKHGASFNLRDWHAFGINLGNLGLDLLKSEMRRF